MYKITSWIYWKRSLRAISIWIHLCSSFDLQCSWVDGLRLNPSFQIRLEQKPAEPSEWSLKQLMRECKEALRYGQPRQLKMILTLQISLLIFFSYIFFSIHYSFTSRRTVCINFLFFAPQFNWQWLAFSFCFLSSIQKYKVEDTQYQMAPPATTKPFPVPPPRLAVAERQKYIGRVRAAVYDLEKDRSALLLTSIPDSYLLYADICSDFPF